MTVPRIFRFMGRSSGVDLARLVDTDLTLRDLHAQLSTRMPPRRARALLEDMLEVALHGAGEHFVGMKGPAIQRILDARLELMSVFEKVMAPGRRQDITPHLKQLEAIYKDIDDGLKELTRPIDKAPPKQLQSTIAANIKREVRAAKATENPHELRPVHADAMREPGQSSTRLSRRGYRKKPNADTFVRTFKSGERVELTIRDNRYHAETFDAAGRQTGKFAEFDTALQPYSRTPKTGSLLQAHHGIEGDLMGALFGSAYNHNAVPTIWLRNNKTGSPHGIVTAMGNMNRAARRDPATLTYSKLRDYAEADMKGARVPHDAIQTYLAAIDSHVRTAILPNLSAKQRADLLGEWKP